MTSSTEQREIVAIVGAAPRNEYDVMNFEGDRLAAPRFNARLVGAKIAAADFLNLPLLAAVLAYAREFESGFAYRPRPKTLSMTF